VLRSLGRTLQRLELHDEFLQRPIAVHNNALASRLSVNDLPIISNALGDGNVTQLII
jgi:hypothetical protein